MGELTTDSTPDGSTPALLRRSRASRTTPPPRDLMLRVLRGASAQPGLWKARPEGSRLVGLVVARDDMPSVVEQRNDLARFGVAILDFKHPTPEGSATWEQRFGRLFETLQAGDMLVVVSERALGQTSDDVARTIRTLRRHNLVLKVLSHGAPHLKDARG
jgi:hypothetical protein